MNIYIYIGLFYTHTRVHIYMCIGLIYTNKSPYIYMYRAHLYAHKSPSTKLVASGDRLACAGYLKTPLFTAVNRSWSDSPVFMEVICVCMYICMCVYACTCV